MYVDKRFGNDQAHYQNRYYGVEIVGGGAKYFLMREDILRYFEAMVICDENLSRGFVPLPHLGYGLGNMVVVNVSYDT